MNRRVTSTVLKKPKDIHLSAFRLIDRFTVDKMLEIQTAFPFIPALMFTVTKKVINVSLDHRERFAGKSNYNVKRMIQLSSRLLINNSTIMLDMIATMGILIAAVSFFGIMTIVGLRISGIAFARAKDKWYCLCTRMGFYYYFYLPYWRLDIIFTGYHWQVPSTHTC